MPKSKSSGKYLVSILMGSASDWDTMSHAKKGLDDLGVSNDMRVLSAHRTPDALQKYLKKSIAQGVQVFIAAAGMAAHLAGAVAAHTTLPVIGVPLAGPNLDGLDALLSTVQMPGGVPVATVAIGKAGAKNAAILAAQMLGIKDSKLAGRVAEQRKKAAREVLLKDRQMARKAG
ncbi:MAG: 5-(carboxyamino)imidazole ribonucleotide mutase [bacterium]|nr:5-(carboxyamino)imidazole ribonucleotide mutase [bacterium]